jgi:hypothetical protein
MASQEAFNAAAFAYAGNHALLGAVAQIIGMDKAIEVDSQVYGQIGVAQGQQIKAQAGIEGDADLQTTFSILSQIVTTLGIDYEVIESSESLVAIKVGMCPIYAGATAVGWEHGMIAASCGAAAVAFLDTAAKQFNPKLTWRLRSFRGSQQDGCVEELVLEP